MENSIVIIGGMGPQASLELHRILVAKFSQSVSAPDQYPNILHASISVPDFITSAVETRRAIHNINHACSSLPLEQSGAIGLACNTAHLLLPSLPRLHSKKFVSMIHAVCNAVASSGHQTIGLLASPFTIASGLYEIPLTERGLTVLTPSGSEIDEIADIIRGVVVGKPPQRLRRRLTRLSDNLKQRGADCIILGCTELPLIGVDSSVPVFNSLGILASALLAEHGRVQ